MGAMSVSGQGDGFAWAGANNPSRDRSGHGQTRKPRGGMQVLGKPAQSRAAPRAVPVTPAAAETAAAGSSEPVQASSAEPTHSPAPADGPAAAASPASAAPAQPPAGVSEPSPTAQATENGAAEPAPTAAAGAAVREGTPGDGDRSAEQGSSSGAGPPVGGSPRSPGQRQGRGRGNGNQRSPHRSGGQQGNQRWGPQQPASQVPRQQPYQAYPSQIPPTYQGYTVYPPNPTVPQIPFGQQQVLFGSMPVQVPAAVAYVPVVPPQRTYATSYAAASSRTLQPTAAPFVSSTASGYTPYQVKPAPGLNHGVLPPQSAVPPAAAPPPSAQPPVILSPPRATQSASSQPGRPTQIITTPRKGAGGLQQPPVALTTVTPPAPAATTTSQSAGPPAAAAPESAEAPVGASEESKVPVVPEAPAAAAKDETSGPAAASSEAAPGPRPDVSREPHASAGPNEAAPHAVDAPASSGDSGVVEPAANAGTPQSTTDPARARQEENSSTAPAETLAQLSQQEPTSGPTQSAAAPAPAPASDSAALAEEPRISAAEEKPPSAPGASQPPPATASATASAQQRSQQQQQQQQRPAVPAKPASLLPATAGWAGKRKIAASAPAAAPPPAPAAQPASASRPTASRPAAISPAPAQPASAKPTMQAAAPATATAQTPAPSVKKPKEESGTTAAPAPEPTPASKEESSAASGADKAAKVAPEASGSSPQPAKASPAAEMKPAVEGSSKAANEPAATSLPPAPAPVAVTAPEPPKPKSWATMAKALTEGGSTTFRPPPTKPVTPKVSTPTGSNAAADRSRQARGLSESGRSAGRRDASRDVPRDGQRGRGRGEPGTRREDGGQHRMAGDRSRDGRDRRGPQREARPAAPASASSHMSSAPAAAAPAPASQASAPAKEQHLPGPSSTPVSSSAPAPSVAASPEIAPSTAAQLPEESEKPEAEEAMPASGSAPAPSTSQPDATPEEPSDAKAEVVVPTTSAESSAPTEEQASATAEPQQPTAAEPAKAVETKQLSGPVLDAVRRLCGAVDELSDAPSHRFLPRGLVNTGNLCFMNSILQALMGGRQFCAMLQQLQAAGPAFTPTELPTLHAFAALAAEFLQAASPDTPGPLPNGDAGKAAAKEPVYKARDAPAPKTSAWSRPDSAGANAVTLAARLNQQALLPDMMFPTVNRFNPNNGRPLPTTNGKATTAAAAAAAAATRQQEDAQEFLGFLLDSAHQELLRLRALHAHSLSDSGEQAKGTEGGGDDEEWLMAGRSKKKKAVTRGTTSIQGGTTLASAVFGGALRSEVKAAGAPASATLEPCFVVHLDIQPDAVRSVSDALHAFTSPETIHGYKVRDGSEPVTARKVVQLYALPRILVLHLKRFAYTGHTGTGKIHKTVHYGDRLRIQPSWMAEGCPDARHRGGADYDLIAVVHHHGRTPASGHYTADVRQPDGKWLRFDDADLSAVSLARVVDDNKAYLLFYQLRE
ncbi:probable ubiquitin carboxyl-terminal hydrolase 10 at C-terminar half [Coccomyxa sp. Obi]|nr:probable ubiquitin carboxyl-terminal hydrolase 10 at C-terminar half [Coccomyxa sp. Obi]